MKTKYTLIITFIIGTMLLTSGCKSSQVSKQDVPNVKVIEAAKSDIEIQDEYAGEIVSSDESGVVPKTGGKVASVLVDVGTRVNKGDLLFTIDSSDLLAQLNQAQIGVELAKANLNRTVGSSFSQSLIQSQSAVEQAQINYNDAKLNYDKIKSLYNSGAIAKKDFDGADTRLKASEDQLDLAKQNLQLLQGGIKPDLNQGAQGQLEQAEASVELIKSQLNNMRVVAPISGVVIKKNINVGEGVSMAAPAIVISNTDNLYANVNILERLIQKIKKGDKIKVTVDSAGNKSIEGVVDRVNPVADAKSHSYTVKVKLNGNNDGIKPGMFAKIKLSVDKKVNVLTVPNQAVMSDNGVQYIFIVSDEKVVKKVIKVGVSNDTYTEITDGLNEGDKLICEGQNFLSDGQKVNIVK